MALFRVNASSFPRQFEVQTRCLMTVLRDQSGHGVALAYELSETPGMEEYTFLRLTSSSFMDGLTGLMSYDPNGCSLNCDGAAVETTCGGSHEFSDEYAPMGSAIVPSWSTTTSVGKAGWTQVVIQGGQHVLLDVNIGQSMAMVNASINDVLEADYGSPFRLCWLGGVTSDQSALRRLGRTEMNNSSISCPSFNEVTI